MKDDFYVSRRVENSSEELQNFLSFFSVIGYGLTDTGRSVLTGVLVIALGIAVFGLIGNGTTAKKKSFNTLQQQREKLVRRLFCKFNQSSAQCYDGKQKKHGFVQKKRRSRKIKH